MRERQSDHALKKANRQRHHGPQSSYRRNRPEWNRASPHAFPGNNQRRDWNPDRMLHSDQRTQSVREGRSRRATEHEAARLDGRCVQALGGRRWCGSA